MTAKLETGHKAPDFTLRNQDGDSVTLSAHLGQKVVVYFYPAASTPGCTTQACEIRDNINSLKSAGYTVLGISPDELMAGLAGGGEASGMPPEGMPPEAGAPKMAAAQELQMIGNAVANFKRSGGFQIKEARTKRSRQLRDIMKAHVRELTSR